MLKQTESTLCSRCKSTVHGNFCIQCGNPQKLERINGKYLVSEIGSVLNFEKGILYTIRELLLRPETSIQKFIHEDRNRLVKPVIFILITSLVYTLAEQMLHFEEPYINATGLETSTTGVIFIWIQQNYGYANIITSVFIALWIRILFRKYDYNFFEILILLFFVIGIGMLIYTIFGIAENLLGLKVLHIGGMMGVVYAAWAIGRFFDKRKKANYLKGIASYFLGFFTCLLLIVIVGNLIDLIFA